MVIANAVDNRKKTAHGADKNRDRAEFSKARDIRAPKSEEPGERPVKRDAARLHGVSARMPAITNQAPKTEPARIPDAVIRAITLRLLSLNNTHRAPGADFYETNIAAIKQKLLEQKTLLLEYLAKLTPLEAYKEFLNVFIDADAWFGAENGDYARGSDYRPDAKGRKRALSLEYAKQLEGLKETFTGPLKEVFLSGLDKAYEEFAVAIDRENAEYLKLKAWRNSLSSNSQNATHGLSAQPDGFYFAKAAQPDNLTDRLREPSPALYEFFRAFGLDDAGVFSHVFYGKGCATEASDFPFSGFGDEYGQKRGMGALTVRSRASLIALPSQPQLSFRYTAAFKTHAEQLVKALGTGSFPSLDAQLFFQISENEKWIAELRQNDRDLFNYHLYSHRVLIEAGKPELAWLPAGFSMSDYRAHINDDWTRYALRSGVLSELLKKKERERRGQIQEDTASRISGVTALVVLVFILF